MTILCDSREHWTHPNSKDKHISAYFDRHGIEWRVQKLDCGDYMLSDDHTIVVDRKKSLDEIATNMLNRKDSSRFWREVRRCHSQGIRLVILCECGGKIKTINDVVTWHSQYSSVTGRRLINEMIRCEMAYGVTWLFCDKRSTARRIVEILTRKER